MEFVACQQSPLYMQIFLTIGIFLISSLSYIELSRRLAFSKKKLDFFEYITSFIILSTVWTILAICLTKLLNNEITVAFAWYFLVITGLSLVVLVLYLVSFAIFHFVDLIFDKLKERTTKNKIRN